MNDCIIFFVGEIRPAKTLPEKLPINNVQSSAKLVQYISVEKGTLSHHNLCGVGRLSCLIRYK